MVEEILKAIAAKARREHLLGRILGISRVDRSQHPQRLTQLEIAACGLGLFDVSLGESVDLVMVRNE